MASKMMSKNLNAVAKKDDLSKDDKETTMITIQVSDCDENKKIEFKEPFKSIVNCEISKNFNYFKILMFFTYNLYLLTAIHKTWHKAQSCCDGIKFLVILTLTIYFSFLSTFLIQKCFRPFCRKMITKNVSKEAFSKYQIWFKKARTVGPLITLITVCIFCLFNVEKSSNLISGLGIIFFIGFAWICSSHRSHVKWNQVLWGILLQFILANLILNTHFGQSIFTCLGNKITNFLQCSRAGTEFVFGHLVTDGYKNSELIIFAFTILPIIIFFNFVVSILYYYGIMYHIIIKLGYFLHTLIGTTACESLSASANIFLGMAESPLLIEPYLSLMTNSELFTVMTSGFATIAGAVLVAYISFGINASYLLSASVMAAPGSLGLSKLFYPEIEISLTKTQDIIVQTKKEKNALEAGANGANQALKLVAGIVANMIAILAFIQALDLLSSWFGSLIQMEFLNFKWLLSKFFTPLTLMMGVDWKDAHEVAQLIGIKTFANEFIAYQELTKLIHANILSKRSQAITTFALCGFSNIPAIGIQMGTLGALIPGRRSDLASMAVKTMIAGSMVTFISASMAGLLINENHFMLPSLNVTTN